MKGDSFRIQLTDGGREVHSTETDYNPVERIKRTENESNRTIPKDVLLLVAEDRRGGGTGTGGGRGGTTDEPTGGPKRIRGAS